MRGWLLSVLLFAAGCAHENQRLVRLQSLDEGSKDLLSKYRQFLTELQLDAFLAQPDQDARAAYLSNLKIDERVAQYPKPVQDAIWSQQIIAGMDKPAVLLTWGSPDWREVDEAKAEVGVESERWGYNRGDRRVEVVVVNGFVIEVREAPR